MQGGQTSRFRGVVLRSPGKWGAQFSVKRKQYWLGTYVSEIEAAIAYDTAVQKLHRRSLNFPGSMSAQEIRFQSMYSHETIVDMIKFGCYMRQFVRFKVNELIFGVGNGLQSSWDVGFGVGSEVLKPVLLFGVRIG